MYSTGLKHSLAHLSLSMIPVLVFDFDIIKAGLNPVYTNVPSA
jgi:hypothetical protein